MEDHVRGQIAETNSFHLFLKIGCWCIQQVQRDKKVPFRLIKVILSVCQRSQTDIPSRPGGSTDTCFTPEQHLDFPLQTPRFFEAPLKRSDPSNPVARMKLLQNRLPVVLQPFGCQGLEAALEIDEVAGFKMRNHRRPRFCLDSTAGRCTARHQASDKPQKRVFANRAIHASDFTHRVFLKLENGRSNSRCPTPGASRCQPIFSASSQCSASARSVSGLFIHGDRIPVTPGAAGSVP